MSVMYKVRANGQDVSLTPQQIMFQANQAMQASGKTIQSITPDGLSASVSENGQVFEVPIQALLGASGMEVRGVAPMGDNIDYDTVNASRRFSIANLDSDQAKASYLKSSLEKEGKQVNSIIGQGRDFYYYDQETGRYKALTNSPDWELADLVEGANTGARMTGGLAGGLAGGTVANVPGAMAGGAAGTALAEAGTRGLAAALDPSYREAFRGDEALKAGGIQTVLGGVIPGVAAGVQKVAGNVLGQQLGKIATAPMSSATQAAGYGAQGVGKLGQIGTLGATETGSTIGTAFTPGLGTVQMAGMLAQLPQQAVMGLSKAGQWVGKKVGAEEAAKKIFAGETADQVLSNLGAATGRGLAKARGMNPINRADTAEEVLRKAGTSTGKAFEGSYKGGEAVQQLAEEAFRLPMRAMASGGRGLESLGKGMVTAGKGAAPHELSAYMQGTRAALNSPDRQGNLQTNLYRDFNEPSGQPMPPQPQGEVIPIGTQPTFEQLAPRYQRKLEI